jgi:hypothetical protein
MKPLPIFVIILCCVGAGYGYWGAFTDSGNKVYEEMAALIPFYIMLGSVSILIIMGLYYAVMAIIKKGNS